MMWSVLSGFRKAGTKRSNSRRNSRHVNGRSPKTKQQNLILRYNTLQKQSGRYGSVDSNLSEDAVLSNPSSKGSALDRNFESEDEVAAEQNVSSLAGSLEMGIPSAKNSKNGNMLGVWDRGAALRIHPLPSHYSSNPFLSPTRQSTTQVGWALMASNGSLCRSDETQLSPVQTPLDNERSRKVAGTHTPTAAANQLEMLMAQPNDALRCVEKRLTMDPSMNCGDHEHRESLDKFWHRALWLIALLILQSLSSFILKYFGTMVDIFSHPFV